MAELRAQLGGQPATPAPPAPAAPAGPPKPVFADFEAQIGAKYETYAAAADAYQDARDDWREQKAVFDAEQQAATERQTAAERAITERVTKHQERERAFAVTRPDYDTKTRDLRAQLNPAAPLTQALLESDVSPQLIDHFVDHPDDLARIGALGTSNLPAALRELGKLEAKYDPSATPAAPAATAALPKKTVTSAPEPPTTLGTRAAEPADASRAAVAAKDFRAFDEAETRKDLARRGRR